MYLEIDGGDVWSPQDGLGVPINWEPTIPQLSDMEPEKIAKVLKELGDKKWSQHASSKLNWVGIPVAHGTGDDVLLSKPKLREHIYESITWLIHHGYLQEIEERRNGKDRKFYIGVAKPIGSE